MDYIILGLLLLKSRTIYQLRERIRQGLDLMYSSSMGSIQAAIKKLLNHGYITYEENVENGKYKKIYTITNLGERYFLAWVNSPVEVQNAKNPELAKVYFMGFADQENRKNHMEKYLFHLTEKYHALNAICEEAQNINVAEENKDIFFYQFSAACYGRDFMKFNMEWFQKLIEEMEDKK